MKQIDIRRLLSLDNSIDIVNVEDKEVNKKTVKYVYIKSNKKKVRCPHCNQFSNIIHDYLKPNKITYLKNSGQETYLIATKRRFECINCNRSFTENLELTQNNCNISLKTKQMILKECLDRDKTLSSIAKDCNVSVNIVRDTFLKAMNNYPDTIITLPEVISFDEVSTYTNEGVYSFIINDPIHKITLDILPNRKKDSLIKYFLKVKNRESVKYVICDLYEPYYEVVKLMFTNAIFIADPFHYTRYVIEGLDKVRIKLEHQYEKNKKSYQYRMLKNRINRKILLKSFDETKYELRKIKEQEQNYNNKKRNQKPYNKYNDFWYGTIKIKQNNRYIEKLRIDRLQEVLDINSELLNSYCLKEDFMYITINATYEEAKDKLEKWIISCYESNIEEMILAAGTIERWLDAIVNSFIDERYSNGFTEANNNTIDKIVDRAYGYKNFKFFRLRALAILHQGYSGGSRKNIEKGKFKE